MVKEVDRESAAHLPPLGSNLTRPPPQTQTANPAEGSNGPSKRSKRKRKRAQGNDDEQQTGTHSATANDAQRQKSQQLANETFHPSKRVRTQSTPDGNGEPPVRPWFDRGRGRGRGSNRRGGMYTHSEQLTRNSELGPPQPSRYPAPPSSNFDFNFSQQGRGPAPSIPPPPHNPPAGSYYRPDSQPISQGSR